MKNNMESRLMVSVNRAKYQDVIGYLFVYFVFPICFIIGMYGLTLFVIHGMRFNIFVLYVISGEATLLYIWYILSKGIGHASIRLYEDHIIFFFGDDKTRFNFDEDTKIELLMSRSNIKKGNDYKIIGFFFENSRNEIVIKTYLGWKKTDILKIWEYIPLIVTKYNIKKGGRLKSYMSYNNMNDEM